MACSSCGGGKKFSNKSNIAVNVGGNVNNSVQASVQASAPAIKLSTVPVYNTAPRKVV